MDEATAMAGFYKERMEKFEGKLLLQQREINRIGNLRLLVFLAGLGSAVGFWLADVFVAAWIGGLLGLGVFVWLVLRHDRLFNAHRRTEVQRDINLEALLRVTDKWHDLADDGMAYAKAEHPFSGDLDLFGPGSVFQWCNTAVTPAGREQFAHWLSEPEPDPAVILARQEAVRELAPRLDWRQDLQTESRLHKGEFCAADALSKWAEDSATTAASDENPGLLLRLMPILVWLLPCLALLTGVLPSLIPGFHYAPLVLALLLEVLLLVWRFKARTKVLRDAEHAASDIRVHQQMLERLESASMNASVLQGMKNRLKDRRGHSASEQAKRLARIIDGLGNRNHQLYIVIDILFLLDWHFLFAIQRWKTESAANLADWVAVNGELEALCTLAGIAHAHPDWVMPEAVSPGEINQAQRVQRETAYPERKIPADCRFRADELGHPLLKAPCVTNSVTFCNGESIHLITGSNMSGKSTLLRTIGVNLVLAMAGAPVYADHFRFSPCRLYTCMRTRDDIEQGISSFYAELLRIKTLVQAVEAGETVFCFLDEIFKGTNSTDRHTGAQALIRWLVGQDRRERPVLGLISTHDLELGSLEESCTGVRNLHFQENYEDGRLHFDYLLKPGVSTTRNALWLMKLAGLPTDEQG